MSENNRDYALEELTNSQESAQELLVLVTNEADKPKNPSPPSIHMAPEILRERSPSSFDPQLVSIGPLHKQDKRLQLHEEKKVGCLNTLLNRVNDIIPSKDILESCMEKVYASMEQIRACYVFTNVIYSDSEIAKMMVIDACFILEFIASCLIYDTSSHDLGKELLSPTIVYDLVLLENQIPFFVLKHIYECTISNIYPDVSLVQFMSPALRELHLLAAYTSYQGTDTTDTTPHILGLLHQLYKPETPIECFPCCTKMVVNLDTMQLKPNRRCGTWDMRIEVKLNRLSCGLGLCSKPVLIMPQLYVCDFTEMVLRNLIAYEHLSQTPDYVTAYACTMGMLVNTQEDVTQMVNSQVLVNDLGSSQEVADMITSVTKNVTNRSSVYDQELKKLKEYNAAYWPRNIAWLRRTYFNNPWNIVALAAGIILFILTVVQTIYSIKSAM